jgi:predicted ATPase
MGLHMGFVQAEGADYNPNHTLNRVARIMAAGYGGQILLSSEVADLVHAGLSQLVSLRDLGQHHMKGMEEPEHIYQLVAPDLPGEFPRIRSLTTFSSNLPAQPTPFVGRETELLELKNLLGQDNSRLLTVVGPGGMGKTRLALAAAEQQLETGWFPDGITFIPLAPLSEVGHIIPAMAQALDFPLESGGGKGESSAKQQLLDYLQQKKMLLLLDNFEHLLDGAYLVVDILQSALDVQILVTSRERLQLRNEQVYPIEGLEFPDWETPEDAERYTAVQLFLQSARRNQPDFALRDGDDLTTLARICCMVAGMPLALELAASWVDMLPLAKIAAELQQGLDLLETDMRDMPERHRSIRSAIDYSWQKLGQKERDIFAKLSLFRGGFTQDAAQTVAEVNLRQLARLVNKSFLQYSQADDRYQVHELLRQYGTEKLDDDTAVARHGRYYCTWLDKQAEALKGDRQKVAMEAIEADIDNIRTAWQWAVAGQAATSLQEAAFSLGTFFYHKGRHEEGLAVFSQAAAALGKTSAAPDRLALAQLYYWRAIFEPAATGRQDYLQSASTILEAAAPDQATRTGQAAILLELGIVAQGQGQHETAERYFEQSLARCRLVGDRWGEANVLSALGVSAWSKGEYDEATHRYGESLNIRQALQDHVGTAVALEGLAGVAMFAGQGEQAIAYTRQSLAIYRQLDDRVGTAVLQAELGHKTWYQNLEGMELIEDSLRIFADLGTRRHQAHWMVILAMYKADVDITAAKELANRGLALCREIGYQRGIAITYGVLSRAAWMEEDYGLAQEWAQFYLQLTEEMSLPLERSDALVWSGWTCLAEGQVKEAEEQIRFVLQTPNLWRVASLNLTAILLAQRTSNHYEWAWQLLGFGASRYGRHRGAVSQAMTRRFMPQAMKAIPPDHITRLQEQGQQLDEESLFPRLLAALA